MKSKLMALMLLAGSTMFGASRFSFGVNIGGPGYVVAPRPPVAAYYAPPAPRVGCSWVGGHYYRAGGRYQWRAGSWARPPYARSYWVAPRYHGGRYYNGYWGRR